MYKVYQSCGHLSISSEQKSAVIETMLPTTISKDLYEYIKFYNISKTDSGITSYGILGVLIVKGSSRNNIDLRTLKKTRMINVLKNGRLDLKNGIDNSFSQVCLSNITEKDRLSFVCFHDTDFEKNKKIVLEHYQNYLYNIFEAPIPTLPKIIIQPKVGNGGILTIEGCIMEHP
ncbi:hypothetical protein [Flavobacterium sp. UBA4197]|uniref:hypothetical protein n=1 Tax=Flavobacterium sp. UBA4197 TaxID=1946546 RepID=UPI00257F2B6A|nr:hypothetical protein [Flavobacterium sp. UBA4197]